MTVKVPAIFLCLTVPHALRDCLVDNGAAGDCKSGLESPRQVHVLAQRKIDDWSKLQTNEGIVSRNLCQETWMVTTNQKQQKGRESEREPVNRGGGIAWGQADFRRENPSKTLQPKEMSIRGRRMTADPQGKAKSKWEGLAPNGEAEAVFLPKPPCYVKNTKVFHSLSE